MQMVAAGRASPRLPLLLRRVGLEGLHRIALRAVGMLTIGRMARSPEVLQAGGVIGELGKELRHRVVGGRRLRSPGIVAVGRWHVVKLLDTRHLVKGLYSVYCAANLAGTRSKARPGA